MNTAKALSTAILISTAIMMTSVAYASNNNHGRGSPGSVVVLVESQGLYYDSIVLADLPQQGVFQELVPGMNGLATEFGPGDVGYLGGRWWIDLNMDGIMDSGDKYFLCPLLGPGRDSP
jgi:hypothetical protein